MKQLKTKLIINYDKSKPDGMPKKCLDISLAKNYGWNPKNNFNNSFKITYEHFLKDKKNLN
jgi:GDP-L-fucose synthase